MKWKETRPQAETTASETQKPAKPVSCEHEKTAGPFEIEVLGSKVSGLISNNYCPAYLVLYLERNSTVCVSCKKPILPSEAVGGVPVLLPEDQPEKPTGTGYIHLSASCGATGGHFCGHWGEGVLVPAYS